MTILLAPDKFKGSLSAKGVCDALESGLRQNYPDAEIIKFPLADGGEGSLAVIANHLDGKWITTKVNDPLFREIEAKYFLSGDAAYIEMAEASGFDLLTKEERNCLYTTTLGTGKLIKNALNRGAKEVYLFIGGSATCDGGMGVAEALGYQFLDNNGKGLKPFGENMLAIKKIIPPEEKIKATFTTLCDVNNPFYGTNGAAHVFGPQKGADEKAVQQLDAGLKNLAEIVERDLGKSIAEISGAGAAGGLGGGSVAFLNTSLQSGLQTIMQLVNFEKVASTADVILTGEGKIDGQTLQGKVVQGVVALAKAKKIPVHAVCGITDLSPEAIQELGLHSCHQVMEVAKSEEEAFSQTAKILEKIALKFKF